MTTDLDLAVLARRPPLGARLRAVWASNTWVWSTTIGVLLVVVPVAVVVLSAGARSDTGALVLLAMLAAAGLYVVGMVLHAVAGDAALGALARADGLVLTQASAVTHYAGSRFDGSLLVHRSIRTRDAGFLEVGDTFPVGTRVGGDGVRPTDVFLRVGLAGPVRAGTGAAGLVDAELDRRLRTWAGPYAVEWSERELTLHGSRSLDPRRPDRVRTGFELADELRRRADDLLVTTPAELDEERTLSGVPVPVLPPREVPTGPTSRPLRVIFSLLAFLTIGPLLLAVVLSIADDAVGGSSILFTLVLGLGIAGLTAVAGALVRFATAPGHSRRRSGDDRG